MHSEPACPGRQRRTVRRSAALGVALLSLLTAAADGQERIGRLFFTAAQRESLELARAQPAAVAARAEAIFSVDGIVTRTSGRRTVWIDGIAHHDDHSPTGITLTADRSDPSAVKLGLSAKLNTPARVGARVDRRTAAATDLLGAGRLQVNSPSAAAR